MTWESSDETILQVDENGLIHALKEGTASITIKTENDLSAECRVKVKPAAKPKPSESQDAKKRKDSLAVTAY